MPYTVEVDQSGRIEFTRDDTVMALSDGINNTLLVEARVKRACVTELRNRGISGPTLYVRLFATGLYFLLKGHIQQLSRVVIDIEYFGKEAQIKEHLINLLRRAGCVVHADQIQFQRIGKRSAAHVLALETLRGHSKPDLVLSKEDLLGEFRRKKIDRGLPFGRPTYLQRPVKDSIR